MKRSTSLVKMVPIFGEQQQEEMSLTKNGKLGEGLKIEDSFKCIIFHPLIQKNPIFLIMVATFLGEYQMAALKDIQLALGDVKEKK